MRMKMWSVTIRIKKNDEIGGKRLAPLVMDFLIKAGVSGATVWTGVDGFGKRGKSTLKLEGVTVNMPLIIEVIDGQSKLEPLLPELKKNSWRQRFSNHTRHLCNIKPNHSFSETFQQILCRYGLLVDFYY